MNIVDANIAATVPHQFKGLHPPARIARLTSKINDKYQLNPQKEKPNQTAELAIETSAKTPGLHRTKFPE
jgi:hypothetical protein